MFNTTKVENDLVGIVGLRQPNNPDYAVLDAANIASRSGYFVTDITLAKVEFYKDSQDYEGISDVDFNTLLVELQKRAISSVCNLVFTQEDFQDRNLFYKNANNNVDAEVLDDGFVGWRIDVKKEKNVAFEITRVILDFQGNTPNDITLVLYNTGDPNPIQSKVITISEQHQVEELGWVVDNSGDTYKGDYYLGYNKTATTPIPFKRGYNNANVISSIEGLTITPTQVKGHATSTLFDLDDKEGLSENIGVNPDVLVYDDYTDFIKQNQRLFARGIQLDMGIKMLQQSLSSARVNRNERIGEQHAVRVLQTIDGVRTDSGKLTVIGLREQLNSELSSIRMEVTKLRKGYFGGRIMTSTLT